MQCYVVKLIMCSVHAVHMRCTCSNAAMTLTFHASALAMATLTMAPLYLLWRHSTHYGSRRNLVYLARMYRMPVVATYWDRSTA